MHTRNVPEPSIQDPAIRSRAGRSGTPSVGPAGAAWVLALAVGAAAPAQAGPVFGPVRILPATFFVGADVVAGDLDGDGVPDLIQANPGLAFGPNLVSFRGKLLEDDGSQLAEAVGAPPAGPMTASVSVRVAAGDFDEDGRVDLVALTFGLGLNWLRNEGQSRSAGGFRTAVLVDDLNRFFSYGWPVVLRAPVFEVEDFDADGHLDLLLAPVLLHFWNQSMSSPGLFVWFGRGDGTFEPAVRTPLSAAPVDGDWVDWDGDGRAETFLLLQQQVPNPLQNQPELVRFAVQGRVVQQLGAPQPLPSSLFATSVAHVAGEPSQGGRHAVFVSGHSFPLSFAMQPELWVCDLDAQGTLGSAVPIALPTAMQSTTFGDLAALQAADFDGDGATDLVALHAAGTTAPGELLFVSGPLDATGSHGPMQTLGLGAFAMTDNGPPSSAPGVAPVWVPNQAAPESIALTDFDLDQRPDLLVGGLLQTGSGASVMVSATLTNRTPAVSSHPSGRVLRVGPGLATPAGRVPRAGTSGGLPLVGNHAFALTLGDLPDQAMVAPLAARVHAPFPFFHLPLAIVPEVYGSPRWVQAGAPGGARAQHALPVHNLPALAGARGYVQWVVYDPAANAPLPVYVSEALEIEVGTRR